MSSSCANSIDSRGYFHAWIALVFCVSCFGSPVVTEQSDSSLMFEPIRLNDDLGQVDQIVCLRGDQTFFL